MGSGFHFHSHATDKLICAATFMMAAILESDIFVLLKASITTMSSSRMTVTHYFSNDSIQLAVFHA